jgi:hypothetical protein
VERPSRVVRECSKHGLIEQSLDAAGSYRCPRCASERVARRRRELRQILIREAGGRCVARGYSRYHGALAFHHLDPTTKEFGLAERGLTRSLDAFRREAGKCVLLCANCHAEVEGGVLALP